MTTLEITQFSGRQKLILDIDGKLVYLSIDHNGSHQRKPEVELDSQRIDQLITFLQMAKEKINSLEIKSHSIIIKGLSDGATPDTEYENEWYEKINMESLINHINCEENFVEYAPKNLANKLKSGYMRFQWNPEEEKAYTITEYTTKEKLSDEELTQLANYTQGQWSDGIGEGFEQYPCCQSEGCDVYISPWIPNQKLEVIQTPLS
jgi:hypothetical protein